MINDISNKVSNLENARKSDNKNSDQKAPVKPELGMRSDLRSDDTVEISGLQPVEIPAEKVIEPVSAQDNDVQMLSDVYQKDTARGNEDTKITPTGSENKPAVDEALDPMNSIIARKESSLVDSLTSAYGNKETEVGKVIRMTV